MVNIAFFPMADYFGVTPGAIANTIGYNLLGIAIGPLFYNPLSKTIGRRPTYLLGSVLFIPMVIWMACSKTYISFAVARAFAGLTSSFSQTVPPSTVADIYRKEVRGDKMSLFGLFVVVSGNLVQLLVTLAVLM
jgi:MFS family permease